MKQTILLILILLAWCLYGFFTAWYREQQEKIMKDRMARYQKYNDFWNKK